MFQKDVPLRLHSNYKIGGTAQFFYCAQGLAPLIAAIKKAKAEELPLFILGGGTNLLISDDGFAGLVLKPEIKFLHRHEHLIYAGAGVPMSELLDYAAANGLSGLEWAGGLPGTIGGAIRGNAGAFGGEIKDSVLQTFSLDIEKNSPEVVCRAYDECRFGYRTSIFKESGTEIIIGALFQLRPGDPHAIQQAINEKISFRQLRHPLEYPNIGSIFKNVPWETVPAAHQAFLQHKVKQDPFPVLPTAVLIDQCGLKGVICGGAMISPRHPNFIVNTLDARAEDIESLIGLVKSSVKEKFNIDLEEEVQRV